MVPSGQCLMPARRLVPLGHRTPPGIISRRSIPNGASAASVEAPASAHAQLDREQMHAVNSNSAVTRVIAPPGSGKTRVIEARVRRLVAAGVPPAQHVCVTFTNKAAEELRQRLTAVPLVAGEALQSYEDGGQPLILTFHRLCLEILRRYACETHLPAAKLDPNFTVLDAYDSNIVMEWVALDMLLDLGLPKVSDREIKRKAKQLMHDLSYLKSQHASLFSFSEEEQLELMSEELHDALRRYTDLCRECNAVDFDDLLALSVTMLEGVDFVRTELQQLWRHISVDEYQDVNLAQHTLVRLLHPKESGSSKGAAPAHSVFTVGDPNQGIYAWRGGNRELMLRNFKEDYPGCETKHLTVNYRSGSRIVQANEAIVGCGGLPRLHLPCHPCRDRKDAGIVEHVQTLNTEDEAAYVAVDIAERVRTERDMGFRDNAVLCRSRYQFSPIAAALVSHGVPFHLEGAEDWSESTEVRDCVAYLSLVASPKDSISLRRIIGKPARGWGDVCVASALRVARSQGLHLATLLTGDLKDLPVISRPELQRTRDHMRKSKGNGVLPPEAVNMVKDLQHGLKAQGLKLNATQAEGLRQLRAALHVARGVAHHTDSAAETLEALLLATSYRKRRHLSASDNRNVDRLLEVARRHDAKQPGRRTLGSSSSSSSSIVRLLQHLKLEDGDTKQESAARDCVTVTTIHMAKGREWKNVYQPACEESERSEGHRWVDGGCDEGCSSHDDDEGLVTDVECSSLQEEPAPGPAGNGGRWSRRGSAEAVPSDGGSGPSRPTDGVAVYQAAAAAAALPQAEGLVAVQSGAGGATTGGRWLLEDEEKNVSYVAASRAKDRHVFLTAMVWQGGNAPPREPRMSRYLRCVKARLGLEESFWGPANRLPRGPAVN